MLSPELNDWALKSAPSLNFWAPNHVIKSNCLECLEFSRNVENASLHDFPGDCNLNPACLWRTRTLPCSVTLGSSAHTHSVAVLAFYHWCWHYQQCSIIRQVYLPPDSIFACNSTFSAYNVFEEPIQIVVLAFCLGIHYFSTNNDGDCMIATRRLFFVIRKGDPESRWQEDRETISLPSDFCFCSFVVSWSCLFSACQSGLLPWTKSNSAGSTHL